jgi:hypothetical protein
MSDLDDTTLALLAELKAMRAAYLDFWGAHTSEDITRLGREPRAVQTPVADRLQRAIAESN